jgi:hypothetical protein
MKDNETLTNLKQVICRWPRSRLAKYINTYKALKAIELRTNMQDEASSSMTKPPRTAIGRSRKRPKKPPLPRTARKTQTKRPRLPDRAGRTPSGGARRP